MEGGEAGAFRPADGGVEEAIATESHDLGRQRLAGWITDDGVWVQAVLVVHHFTQIVKGADKAGKELSIISPVLEAADVAQLAREVIGDLGQRGFNLKGTVPGAVDLRIEAIAASQRIGGVRADARSFAYSTMNFWICSRQPVRFAALNRRFVGCFRLVVILLCVDYKIDTKQRR